MSNQQTLSPEDRAELRRSGGSESCAWNQEIVSRTLATAFAASTLKFDQTSDGGPTASLARITRTAMAAFKPVDEIEAMIVAQSIGLHNGAMKCLHQALEQDEPELASKLWTRAADLSRAMVETLEALDRRRSAAAPPPPVPNEGPQPTDNPYRVPPPFVPAAPPKAPSTIDVSTVCQMSAEELKGFGFRRPPDGT